MEENRKEELDMLYIIKSIKNGIKGIYNSIIWLIGISFRNLRVLLLFIIISVAASLGIYYLKKPYYTNQLTISHNRFDNDYCNELITNLNSYIHESKHNPELAKQLSVDLNVAKEIKSFKYLPLNAKIAKIYSDTPSVVLPFKVEVEIYDNCVLGALQTGILKYLETNEFALKKKEIEKQSLEKIEERLDEEMKNLEDLKVLLNKSVVPQSTGNGIILGEPINPVVVYETSMKLFEQKMRVREKQKLNNSFDLVVGFSESIKKSFDIVVYILMGFLFGYIVGMLYLLRRAAKNGRLKDYQVQTTKI